MPLLPSLPIQSLIQRRSRLQQIYSLPILLWAGGLVARNFRANHYPFRASSHFLYFAGLPLIDSVIAFESGTLTLYWDEATPAAAIWHGVTPTATDMANVLHVDQVLPLAELKQWRGKAFATIRSQDPQTRWMQEDLGAQFGPKMQAREAQLADAIIQLRLVHDKDAIDQIKQAISVTVEAHQVGMQATPSSTAEAQVRAAIESVFMAHNMTPAYGSIVTTRGEVLHNQTYTHSLAKGDLLLVDAGAETELGWASDVTRTWPVSGKFSSTQKDLYDIVLAAHDACIEAIAPGVEYRDIHLIGTRVIAEGLIGLGILNGDLDSLLEQNIPAYFFPHGIGHLLGLDVHDMEDLGDLAGYAPGRERSKRSGLNFLRLNRLLQPNMVVTIEPGFYQIPGLLQQAKDRSCDVINWERLSLYQDVRGIRIEDDILVTPAGAQVLTSALPTCSEQICELLQVP